MDQYEFYEGQLNRYLSIMKDIELDAEILLDEKQREFNNILEKQTKKFKNIDITYLDYDSDMDLAEDYDIPMIFNHYYDYCDSPIDYRYDLNFSIAEKIEAKIEDMKKIISYKLTQIIEKTKTAQNIVNSLNMDKEIEEFKCFLNKQKISNLENKANNAIPKDTDLTDSEKTIYYQNEALFGNKETISEYYPNSLKDETTTKNIEEDSL